VGLSAEGSAFYRFFTSKINIELSDHTWQVLRDARSKDIVPQNILSYCASRVVI
jgi:hypothetical protein